MKSLKDEIDESLDAFNRPFRRMLQNIGDFFRYGVSDRFLDWIEDNERPHNKGCLWTVIKWFLVIIFVKALFGGYPFNKEAHREPVAPTGFASIETEAQSATVAELPSIQDATEPYPIAANDLPDNLYDIVFTASKANVDAILAQEPINVEALKSEYEFLLSLKTSEYLFKAYAYGNFTGEYDVERFQYLLDECNSLRQEAISHIPEEEINTDMEFYTANAVRAFNDSNFDYDSILIGTNDNPDVDAMWIHYVEATTEVDFQDIIDAYHSEPYPSAQSATPHPATVPMIPDRSPTDASKNNLAEETYSEGYVMYGTGGLNIRNGPGVSYVQIGRLPEGEHVTILEMQYSGTSEWGRIDRGWICLDYIQTDSVFPKTYETDFFTVTLPGDWDEKYAIEHRYSVRSETLVFYYKAEYDHYQYTYSETGRWPFAIEVRSDGDTANAIAGWEPVGIIASSEGYTYNVFIHYPLDPQFMDASYNGYLSDAHSIAASIKAKDGYTFTQFY